MSRILAGALTGLGQGMVQQAQFNQQRDEAQRDREFQTALENLRSRNSQAEDVNRATLQRRNTEAEFGLREREAQRDHKRTLERDKFQTDENIRRDNNSVGNEIRLANVRGAIDRQNDAASRKLQDELDSGDVVDTLLDESGEYVAITRGGTRRRTGVFAHTIDTTFRPTAGLGGGSALFPQLAPQGAAPQTAPMPQPQAAAGGKTMTRADIQATAQGEGMSFAEAKKELEALGYRLVN